MAEVGLDQVGLVLGIEMSRLARSCRDWHHLLEICALFRTLIADQDGVYDPSDYNDRLLLGLKGTMSEAELHILKQRMLEGKRSKARRGELNLRLPMGYLRRPSGEVIKDPDEGAQAVIATVFGQFAARGTIHGVLQYLVEHQIQMPMREYSGPQKGELVWRRPNRQTLRNLLQNPSYAGAYVYGRRPTDPRRKKPGRPTTGRTVAEMGEWEVCLQDRHPAYISWDQYLANQATIKANRTVALGPPRVGSALLCGLVCCGHCGYRMATQYSGPPGRGRYACSRHHVEYGGALCQSLTAQPLDAAIEALVLQTLEPAALELSLQLAGEIETQRAQAHLLWQQRLERARYAVERAWRQFDRVEPENRLVARTLERQWEEALRALQDLEADYQRYQAQQPSVLTATDRAAIRALAQDVPALWRAPTTMIQDRMEIVRQLVERVVVRVLNNSERVEVGVHWAGGHHSQLEIRRPVARWDQLSYYPALLERLRELRGSGESSQAIADHLNAEEWRPPKRCETFTAVMVRALVSRKGLCEPRSTSRSRRTPSLAVDEWTVSSLAAELDMPVVTVYSWVRKGWVQSRKTGPGQRGRLILRADPAELKRLRALRAAPQAKWREPNKNQLTSPLASQETG
jgi:hypothetical protein